MMDFEPYGTDGPRWPTFVACGAVTLVVLALLVLLTSSGAIVD